MHSDSSILSKINNTVELLADSTSYNSVCREHRLGEPVPSSEKLGTIVNMIREILFPGFFGNTSLRPNTVRHYMGVYLDELFTLLSEQILAGLCFECEDRKSIDFKEQEKYAQSLAADFIAFLPEIRRILVTDVEIAFVGDPAAKSRGEVIYCYPAVRAISNYRIAHRLMQLGVPLIPRIISEMAHSETGIDIHPKAEIGESFTIDHGTGVVIGSTCIIGNNVKLYQGVTLGAKSFPLDEQGNPIKGVPRHPIVEDNVIIYAQATILGRIRIGHDSVIGGNVWVTNNVAPNSKVLQFKARESSFKDGAGI
ncbi:serine O-acetyltransferase [Mangrovibacterium diazotrophicum]|uniref:Serine O-acetyltransferase n=1 Tax=Mangrovibacterium diazotrophicum TaxID=1261403 RepID=A0A419W2K7_9BACT|nr:serine acetyltransferase [Mangrovibacterium diazotrophicum]RKD89712.1 serine O-acetyltransferase [Mangrovibacterium diazotrophicum]